MNKNINKKTEKESKCTRVFMTPTNQSKLHKSQPVKSTECFLKNLTIFKIYVNILKLVKSLYRAEDWCHSSRKMSSLLP